MSTAAPPDERASILLVDDMEDNLIALEAVLSSLNEPLVRARSGEEAMKALLRQSFAVVLLDVRMPGMDGFETATNIKRLDQTKDVPIIFLTGTDGDSGYAFRGTPRARRTSSPSRSTPGCYERRWPCSWSCTARTASWSGWWRASRSSSARSRSGWRRSRRSWRAAAWPGRATCTTS